MADVYSNLPSKVQDSLKRSVTKLTEDNYVDPFSFNVGEYDAAIAFFVKRGLIIILFFINTNKKRRN